MEFSRPGLRRLPGPARGRTRGLPAPVLHHGGVLTGLPAPGYKLYLLGSEENEPLKVIPVTNLVVMPRNLGMEMRLFKSLAASANLPIFWP